MSSVCFLKCVHCGVLVYGECCLCVWVVCTVESQCMVCGVPLSEVCSLCSVCFFYSMCLCKVCVLWCVCAETCVSVWNVCTECVCWMCVVRAVWQCDMSPLRIKGQVIGICLCDMCALWCVLAEFGACCVSLWGLFILECVSVWWVVYVHGVCTVDCVWSAWCFSV